MMIKNKQSLPKRLTYTYALFIGISLFSPSKAASFPEWLPERENSISTELQTQVASVINDVFDVFNDEIDQVRHTIISAVRPSVPERLARWFRRQYISMIRYFNRL